jgi:hypothetical protein
LSWFFNVPSGWIVGVGVAPFLGEVFWESVEKLRLGSDRNVLLPLLKAVGAGVVLIFLLFVVLGV